MLKRFNLYYGFPEGDVAGVPKEEVARKIKWHALETLVTASSADAAVMSTIGPVRIWAGHCDMEGAWIKCVQMWKTSRGKNAVWFMPESEKPVYYTWDEARGTHAPESLSIIDIRRCTGLSQAQFAEFFGINYNTLGNWERGVNEPPEALLRALAALVGYADTYDWDSFPKPVPPYPPACIKLNNGV